MLEMPQRSSSDVEKNAQGLKLENIVWHMVIEPLKCWVYEIIN